LSRLNIKYDWMTLIYRNDGRTAIMERCDWLLVQTAVLLVATIFTAAHGAGVPENHYAVARASRFAPNSPTKCWSRHALLVGNWTPAPGSRLLLRQSGRCCVASCNRLFLWRTW
jgi:hypothetical protein